MRRESMITGAHAIIFTKNVDAVRAFFNDVLEFSSVDAGGGWMISALPAAELAAHPADNAGHHELYLMCDDIHATVDELERKGVQLSRPISDERWGLITAIKMPDGGELLPEVPPAELGRLSVEAFGTPLLWKLLLEYNDIDDPAHFSGPLAVPPVGEAP